MAPVGTRFWEMLLREARDLADAAAARGLTADADEVARRTLAAHPEADSSYYTSLERALREYLQQARPKRR